MGLEEQRDADAFAAALQPQEPELQSLPPAANPAPGALDVLLFRGVLLVVSVQSNFRPRCYQFSA